MEMAPEFKISAEEQVDERVLFNLHRLAFKRDEEGDLVKHLRMEEGFDKRLSLVATLDDQVVGHALFNKLTFEIEGETVPAVALAPVAVLPQFQRQGIGSALIKEGIQRMKDLGYAVILVMGDPRYYTRFGFSKDLAREVECPYRGEYLMALELTPHLLAGAKSVKARYPQAFGMA